MTNSQRLATVRKSFLRWIGEDHGSSDKDPDTSSEILSESILVRNDFYCGRRFRAEFHEAVWFIEEDTLKIFQTGGGLVSVMRGREIDEFADSPSILVMPSRSVGEDHSARRAA